MAWCLQATNHYLSQCWPRSISPHDFIRLHCVKVVPCFVRLIYESSRVHVIHLYFSVNYLALDRSYDCPNAEVIPNDIVEVVRYLPTMLIKRKRPQQYAQVLYSVFQNSGTHYRDTVLPVLWHVLLWIFRNVYNVTVLLTNINNYFTSCVYSTHRERCGNQSN